MLSRAKNVPAQNAAFRDTVCVLTFSLGPLVCSHFETRFCRLRFTVWYDIIICYQRVNW